MLSRLSNQLKNTFINSLRKNNVKITSYFHQYSPNNIRQFSTKGIRKRRMGTERETRSMTFSEYLMLGILGIGGFISFDLIFKLNLGTKKFSEYIGLTPHLQPIQQLIDNAFGNLNSPIEQEILMPWAEFCAMAGAPDGRIIYNFYLIKNPFLFLL